MRKTKTSDIDEFVALSDEKKERIVRQIEAESPQQRLARSRPLNSQERQQWRRFKARVGRPPIGKGAQTISLTMERDLLSRADAYAKHHGLSRSRLVALGLQAILNSAA